MEQRKRKIIIAGILILIIICIVIFVIYKLKSSPKPTINIPIPISTSTPTHKPIIITPSANPTNTPPKITGTDPNGGNTLMQGQYLTQGEQLVSSPITYALHFAGANDPNGQPQGQIYVADTTGTAGFQFFAKNAVNPNNTYLQIDNDGFLKCYDNNMQVILKVNAYFGNKLLMQTDGNLVLYNNTTAVWNSGIYPSPSGSGGDIAPS